MKRGEAAGKLHRIFFVACIGIVHLQAGQMEYIAEFIEKHRVDACVQAELDKLFSNKSILSAFNNRKRTELEKHGFILLPTWQIGGALIAQHSLLPGWIIKGDKQLWYGGRNLTRLFYAEDMKKVVKKYGLESIKIVEEYLYHFPGKKAAFNSGNYVVVSKKLEPLYHEYPSLSDHIIAQVCTFIKKTGYWDAHRGNIFPVRDENGNLKVAFVDTEPFPFYYSPGASLIKSFVGKRGVKFFKQEVALVGAAA